jgi:hypothetical protein
MKTSNVLFIGGAFTILLIVGFCGIIIWALFNEKSNDPFLQTQEIKKSTTPIIKEVPVNVYIHDTIRIKIPCIKQHYETKIDTAE